MAAYEDAGYKSTIRRVIPITPRITPTPTPSRASTPTPAPSAPAARPATGPAPAAPAYTPPTPGGGSNDRNRPRQTSRGTDIASLPVYGPPLPAMGGANYPPGSYPGAPGTPGGQQQQAQGQEPWVGSFGQYSNWEAQFQAEHGRAPNEQDYYDLVDSQNFLQQTGRAPTEREWRNRYYTGTWSGTSNSYGGGGGGGGGWGNSRYSNQQSPYAWTPGMYFWNYGR